MNILLMIRYLWLKVILQVMNYYVVVIAKQTIVILIIIFVRIFYFFFNSVIHYNENWQRIKYSKQSLFFILVFSIFFANFNILFFASYKLILILLEKRHYKYSNQSVYNDKRQAEWPYNNNIKNYWPPHQTRII